MPFDPKQVGIQLVIVGNKQASTGQKLKTYSEKTKAVGITVQKDKKISTSMISIEKGIDAVRNVLSFISGLLRNIAKFLRSIKLPDIDFNTDKLNLPGKKLDFVVVTGIDLHWKSPFEGSADNLDKVAGNIDTARDSLQTIAENLQNIREQLPTIADNILSGSSDMKDAGQDMVDAGKAMSNAGNLLQSV